MSAGVTTSKRADLPSIFIPAPVKILIVSALAAPRMRAKYSRSKPVEGCINLFASSPLLVSKINPLVLISRRPTETQRPFGILGSLSKMVGRPFGSLREQI